MSFEIINSSPDYCFIPFGTGNLYENILNINKREVSTGNHDPRFKGNVSILRKCNFIGATTNNPRSKADKLYSPHLPFIHYDEQWIQSYKYAGYCGFESNVYLLKEAFLDLDILNRLFSIGILSFLRQPQYFRISLDFYFLNYIFLFPL